MKTPSKYRYFVLWWSIF